MLTYNFFSFFLSVPIYTCRSRIFVEAIIPKMCFNDIPLTERSGNWLIVDLGGYIDLILLVKGKAKNALIFFEGFFSVGLIGLSSSFEIRIT